MYPLERLSEAEIRHICKQLWNWNLCDGCVSDATCLGGCPSERIRRLSRYFDYYRDVTGAYLPETRDGSQNLLSSHGDLLHVIDLIQQNTNGTRESMLDSLISSSFSEKTSDSLHHEDKRSAFNLAVKAMLMINCNVDNHSEGLLEAGLLSAPWQGNIEFSKFLSEAFPTTDIPSLNDPVSSPAVTIKSALTARELKKHARISFQPTDDLRHHLRLNQQTGVLEIFHYTSFLKEHLRMTKDSPADLSMEDSIKLGAWPRQLVLETLDSIQKVLFPLSDPKSRALLQSLTLSKTTTFDPDCLRFESSAIRRADEKNISYFYFGARLMALYHELENPMPRSWIEKWLERRSAPRYVMMATLVGVTFAVLLGVAGLAVALFQTWIAYQQWKHPISTGG